MSIISGVYEIVNLVNGKRYIGSSTKINERWQKHKYHLRRNKHQNTHLQRAWNKYGENNFQFKEILLCTPEETLLYEQEYIDKVKPEYNIATCAVSPARGAKRSTESREKMSISHKGQIAWNKGLTNIYTNETRKRISDSLKKIGSSWNKGKKLSQEGRKKLSESHKGKPMTENTRNALYEANKGRVCKEETRKKIGDANKGKSPWCKGKKLSKETIEKMKKAWIERRERSEKQLCQP